MNEITRKYDLNYTEILKLETIQELDNDPIKLETILGLTDSNRLKIRLGNFIRDFVIIDDRRKLLGIKDINEIDRIISAKNFILHLYKYSSKEMFLEEMYQKHKIDSITLCRYVAHEIDLLIPKRYFVEYCLQNGYYKDKTTAVIGTYFDIKSMKSFNPQINFAISGLKYVYNHDF